MDHMDDGFGPGFSSSTSGPPSNSLSAGSSALPSSGVVPVGTHPMGIPIPSRPGRYDAGVETTPLTPPSSSHNLSLIFDSSKIYEAHPHKYRLLQGSSTSTGLPGTSKVQSGVQFDEQEPSKTSTPAASLSVKDGRVIAMGGSVSSTTSSDSTSTTAASSTWAADPKRSEAQSTANPVSALPPSGSLSSAPFSDPSSAKGVRDQVSDKTAKTHLIPKNFLHSFTAKVVQPSSSSQISGTQGAAGTTSTFQEPSPQPSSESANQASIQGTLGAAKSLQGISSLEKGAVGGCQTVQPPARRLFGFGPLYHPLPETVCGSTSGPGEMYKTRRHSSSPSLTGLTDTVRHEGITGVGYSEGSRKGGVDVTDSSSATRTATAEVKPKEKRLSPSEVNTWLTGTF